MLAPLVALTLLASPTQAAPGLELSEATLPALEQAIAPTWSERAFSRIDWRTHIEPALEEAKATQRPILLWVMNGNPAGTV